MANELDIFEMTKQYKLKITSKPLPFKNAMAIQHKVNDKKNERMKKDY